ncbi:DUF3267 domain-containing protein [Robertmurraya andreesenii]|uniref:DUF3267 domain-containing protein n=1 Tax=Anoxybacillus andreesenii TaxID=1325932 RepID=A0ABT9UYI6_9BACL|nr:DUF3267 domain-containing protein [Robertmurraya andreesenii]MDQ0153749.1 hypothetical protein [Robertmurraya andreesenii]
MNCWKTVNYSKQYGSQRMFILSLITMLLTFIILYIPLSYFFAPNELYDNQFVLFIFGIILMYPLHKLLHYLPVAHLGSKIRKRIEWKYGVYPFIEVKVHEPISKPLFLFALFLPFISITILLAVSCFLFPHYVHYFAILMAYQIGLSVPDIAYGLNILKAPKAAFIEENDDGFEILIHHHQVRNM